MAASLLGVIKILFFNNLSLAAPTEVLALSVDQAGSLSTSTLRGPPAQNLAPSPRQSCDLGGWMSSELSHQPARVTVETDIQGAFSGKQGVPRSLGLAPGRGPGAACLCLVCISVCREPCGPTLLCSQCSHGSGRLLSCEHWNFRRLPMYNIVCKWNEKILSTDAVVWMLGNTPMPPARFHP